MTFEQRLYSPLPESNSSKWRAIKVTTQFNRLDTGDLIKEIVMNLPNHVELTYMRESYYCVGFPHYNPYTDIAYVHALGGGNSGQPYWEWLSPWAAPDFHRHI